MPDYRITKTNYTEDLSVDIFQKLNIKVVRNNQGNNTTAVDLVSENGIKIDVQYSQNFARYGDLRLDFVSAYSHNGQIGLGYSKEELFNLFEIKYGYKVNKKGKYFQDDYLDAVIILFYDKELIIEKADIFYEPNTILIMTKKELMNYLHTFKEICLQATKLNIKTGLGDTHGSAFIPINVNHLRANINCAYGDLTYLKTISKEIKDYLSC